MTGPSGRRLRILGAAAVLLLGIGAFFLLPPLGVDAKAAQRALEQLAPAFVATSLLPLLGALVRSLGHTSAVAVFSGLMAVGVVLALLCDLFIAPRVAARLGRRRGG